jgi:uncharacterized protein YqeY
MTLRDQLRAALPAAIKARDRTAVAALRSTLAAIDNAEAVPPDEGADGGSLAIEHVPIGAGATEVPRRELTAQEIELIVRDEVADREIAADGYGQAGQTAQAEKLLAEAEVLEKYLKHH